MRSRFFIWMPLVTIYVGWCAYLIVNHFIISPGIENCNVSSEVIPPNIILHEAQAFINQQGSRLLFTISTIAVLLATPFFLWVAFKNERVSANKLKQIGLLISIGILVSGGVLLYWGNLLGVPSIEHLTGGTFYSISGLFSISFGALLLFASIKNNTSLIKEWGLFSIACALTMPSFYMNLVTIKYLNIPDYFLAEGHGYLLASSGSLMLFIAVFIYSAYGSATHEKIAY